MEWTHHFQNKVHPHHRACWAQSIKFHSIKSTLKAVGFNHSRPTFTRDACHIPSHTVTTIPQASTQPVAVTHQLPPARSPAGPDMPLRTLRTRERVSSPVRNFPLCLFHFRNSSPLLFILVIISSHYYFFPQIFLPVISSHYCFFPFKFIPVTISSIYYCFFIMNFFFISKCLQYYLLKLLFLNFMMSSQFFLIMVLFTTISCHLGFFIL